MTKNEAAELFNGLITVKDLKSKEFALKASKNMTAIREALKDVEELGRPSEEFMKLSTKVQEILSKDPENGREEIDKLEKENKELVEQRKTQLDLVQEKLKEEIEIELNFFSESILPEEVTADQINKLIKIIE